jgi:hypothetical protein
MTTRCLIVLAVSGIIVIFVMNFGTNANKHIHIPEYILKNRGEINGRTSKRRFGLLRADQCHPALL